ncbi:transcriptional regulator [Candidatus Bathyarchaeota archaeon]|nr:transcriptional regulator [Candidatus Bathyarchaeota archaeon]
MRRTSLDVYVDILQAAETGANKTRLVYRANLNFEIIKRYMKNLIENGLLEEKIEGKFFTTRKGLQFVEQYKDLVVPLNMSALEVRD